MLDQKLNHFAYQSNPSNHLYEYRFSYTFVMATKKKQTNT